MIKNLPDKELAKRLGWLSWSTGIQFFSLMILYAAIADVSGIELRFRQAPPLGIGIILGLIFLGDWGINAYVIPALVLKMEKPREAMVMTILFLLFSLLSRFITVFSLLINTVRIEIDFIWLYWSAPLGAIFFSIVIFMLSKTPIAYSRGRRLRLLATINFLVSLFMFVTAVINYYIVPLDFNFWNMAVFIYSYKVGIMAIAFALEYDSWATEIEKVSQVLEDEKTKD
ncbi:MAG: hypothetical protein D6732_20645 [Methanobacteriota archaeon]|nr:MAG: hypothetical protein D6732_20645 [Euryarchaeota archaeon]